MLIERVQDLQGWRALRRDHRQRQVHREGRRRAHEADSPVCQLLPLQEHCPQVSA